MILHDRSRCVADWRCPRLRFLQYELDGRGIVPDHTALELYLGQAIHDGLAAIAGQQEMAKGTIGEVDINTIASTAFTQVHDQLLTASAGEDSQKSNDFANEQGTLVEGLLRGFYKHAWPRLMEQYPEIVMIEQECQYKHDGMIFMSRPDLVVADQEGCNFYIEYKSTSSKREEWINSWATAVQLHSSIKAIEETLDKPVTGVIVQGLYKGYVSYGKQNSPLCYAYHRSGNPPFTQDQTLYEYKAGFKRVPTWLMEGGVKKWIDGMPENILADQFPQTPLLYLKEDLINAFFAQRADRERQIDLALQMLAMEEDEDVKAAILNTAFDQHYDQCTPSFGRPCQYKRICFGQVTEPLKEGWAYREPHHMLELDTQEQELVNT
jgi:hypothetical protein